MSIFIKPALIALSALTAATAMAEPLALDLDDVRQWTSVTGDFSIAPDAKRASEKIQGSADFIKVASLSTNDPNRRLSRKVGQLFLPASDATVVGFCSGSLVGPDLFLTNHHCINSDDGALKPEWLLVGMDHVSPNDAHIDPNGAMPASALGEKGSVSAVTAIVAQDKALDYALLRLTHPLGERYGWLRMESDQRVIDRHRAVKIIQHPAGRSKEIVLQNTEIVQTSGAALHYLADTEGGSSGSPVFSLQGDVIIGLHHVGTNRYNEAMLAPHIVTQIGQHLPAATGPTPPVRSPSPAGSTSSSRANPALAADPAAAQDPPQQPAAPADQPPQEPQEDPADKDGGWVPFTGN